MVYQDAMSISLSTGTWEVSAAGSFSVNSATATAFTIGISTYSGTSSSGLAPPYSKMDAYGNTAIFNPSNFVLTIPKVMIYAPVQTTVYLKIRSTFSTGNPTFYNGSLVAVRK
jgi:hypothetical protein